MEGKILVSPFATPERMLFATVEAFCCGKGLGIFFPAASKKPVLVAIGKTSVSQFPDFSDQTVSAHWSKAALEAAYKL